MSQFLEIIGGKPLNGTVRVSGAKNEVTKLMVASVLFDRPLVLENVPAISDVEVTADLLKSLGASIEYQAHNHRLKINGANVSKHEAVYSSDSGSSSANRLSILLAGPLLYRFGKAVVQKPGGCRIGERPLDLHLYYLRQLGIKIAETDTLIELEGALTGGVIEFPYKSVGATEGALLSSVYAKGRTIIKNSAHEPEIIELITVLQEAGAMIEYDSEGNIHITGTDKPLFIDHPISIIGDRLEAMSYLIAAVATDGKVTVEGIDPRNLTTALTHLRRLGADVVIEDDKITASRGGTLKPLMLETDPHPALATDLQQIFVVLLSRATGTSYMHETVFDKRFAYLEQLNILGGNFSVAKKCAPFRTCRFSDVHDHTAKISGPVLFHGGVAKITDLRAAFALTIAGLLATQPTTLHDAHHLLRGYDNVIGKLQSLGASIKLGDD